MVNQQRQRRLASSLRAARPSADHRTSAKVPACSLRELVRLRKRYAMHRSRDRVIPGIDRLIERRLAELSEARGEALTR